VANIGELNQFHDRLTLHHVERFRAGWLLKNKILS